MKYKLDCSVFFLWILVVTFILVSLSLFMPKFSNLYTKSVDINEVIDNIKNEETATFLYESISNEDITSLIFTSDNKYTSYIISNTTGEILNIDSILNTQELETVELELLNYKYPTFVVEGITSTDGYKTYIIKDNEMIIYYYDYNYAYDLTHDIYLTINYNEIDEYLNFKHSLDDNYTNESGYDYDNTKKSVAITFDDGPSINNNARILEILVNNKAQATFFMVGSSMEKCPICVYNTYTSGNEIGSHTYEHMNMKRFTIAEIQESLDKTNEIYESITRDTIKLVRPPYGAYNKEILSNIDNIFILWNIDTEDWATRDSNATIQAVLDNITDGSIILMHESYSESVDALEELLPILYSMDYQVVSVSTLATLKGVDLTTNYAYGAIK